MDFELSDDQVALVDGIRALLDGRFDIAAVRSLETSGGVDRSRWRDLAETGLFSLVVPEDEGGVGLGYGDAVLVFEALGRALVPGPLVATFLAVGLVEGAAEGETVVGVVERPPPGSGPLLIEYLGVVDVLLVLDERGVWRLDPSTLDARPMRRPLDPLVPVWHVATLPEGDLVAGGEVAAAWRVRGATLTSALQLGVADGACTLATAYAKERRQFGKPIGQFQAIKHLCADMLSRVEVCRAAVYMAGVCIDDPEVGDPARAASVARILADTTSSENGKDCVQVHGGMGYTWEVDAHLYVKRAWALAAAFGSSDDHAEALAAVV
jgi:alkylation response protein AidB-like acyl-CoA dehydrogenase